jgi:hypothetical protein
MPLYTYRCHLGHEHEMLVRLDELDAPTCCPVEVDYLHLRPSPPGAEGSQEPHSPLQSLPHTTCNQPVQRVMSVNAKCFPGADSWRR